VHLLSKVLEKLEVAAVVELGVGAVVEFEVEVAPEHHLDHHLDQALEQYRQDLHQAMVIAAPVDS